MFTESFGFLVRIRRKGQRWSIDEFCRQMEQKGVKVSRAYIVKIELHDEIPCFEFIYRFGELFHMNQDTLWEIAKRSKLKHVEQRIEQARQEFLATLKKETNATQ